MPRSRVWNILPPIYLTKAFEPAHRADFGGSAEFGLTAQSWGDRIQPVRVNHSRHPWVSDVMSDFQKTLINFKMENAQ
jgi:hypothetical protein